MDDVARLDEVATSDFNSEGQVGGGRTLARAVRGAGEG
jgi:hypothetical protein